MNDLTPSLPLQPEERRQAQRRRMLRATLAMAAGGLFGGAARAAPTGASAQADTRFHRNFTGARLLDQDGRRFEPARLTGRFVLINFVFTGCSTVCPVQTRALVEFQRQLPQALRSRVHLLSVSLDPLGDTPAALNAFALRMGADLSGWTFATGRPQDIERIAESLRLFRPGPDVRKPDDHNTALWLVDTTGQLRMRYSGNPVDVGRLLREITALDALDRETAARGRVADPSEQTT